MEMAYAQAVALKRRQLWLGLLLLAVLVLLSGHVAEISFSKLYQHIGGFASYIDRIFHLENGRPSFEVQVAIPPGQSGELTFRLSEPTSAGEARAPIQPLVDNPTPKVSVPACR